ncbi:ISAs1 family transposase [Sporolactobacillus sp. KGMB 08714]|uniref:ISAs1 family transposase n=1 Tax=Sporolactobacillus sp. KGMB 08714 TaxID=3064704 RepID=UPI002FBE15BA
MIPYFMRRCPLFDAYFSLLDPEAVECCFMNWTADVYTLVQVEVVAIDGKTLRGSHLRADSKWASYLGDLTKGGMAQPKVEGKTNEITVIPNLLELLNLKGCVVTIDTMGTERYCHQDQEERSGLCVGSERQPIHAP